MLFKKLFNYQSDWNDAAATNGHVIKSTDTNGSSAAHDQSTDKVVGEWIVAANGQPEAKSAWMFSKEKQYTILVKVCHYRGNQADTCRENSGSLSDLIKYHSYTLECCPSSKPIKTIRSLISQLNKAYEYKEAACYTRTSVELKA